MCLQTVQVLSNHLPNRLSTRNTSSLVFLQVLDTILTPLPEVFSRRYQEVYFMQYVSWQCGSTSGVGALTSDVSATALAAGLTCNQFTSIAYYDVKWYSQLDVSRWNFSQQRQLCKGPWLSVCSGR